MYIYTGLATHAAVLPVRWMTINQLIYKLNGHSGACFQTCKNITIAKQLRKMPGKGEETFHHKCAAINDGV